jgi:hypothetical protein
MRKLIFSAALMFAAPAAHAQTPAISWSIAPDGAPDATEVQLTIESRWAPGSDSILSNSRRIDELTGLNAAQLRGPTQPARFTLTQEAGRLDCIGTAGGLTGRGSCTLTPNPAFVSYLAARGIGRPTERQIFSLTMSGVGRELIEAMNQLG